MSTRAGTTVSDTVMSRGATAAPAPLIRAREQQGPVMDQAWQAPGDTDPAITPVAQSGPAFNLGLSRRAFKVLWSLLEAGAVAFLGGILLWLAVHAGLVAADDLRIGLCLAAGPAHVLLAWMLGRHARPRHSDEPPWSVVAQVMAALFACLLAVALANDSGVATIAWIAVWAVLATGAMVLAHRLEGAIVPLAIARRWRVRHAVIVGAGPAVLRRVKDMAGRMDYEIELLGMFGDRPPDGGVSSRQPPYLGGLESLFDFLARHGARHDGEVGVFMALPWTAGDRTAAVLERLRTVPVTVWLVPDPELSALALPQSGPSQAGPNQAGPSQAGRNQGRAPAPECQGR
ncbi:nucleoside-diphosphate sugar epimerase/dehydratase [Nitrospirillum amazonense]|uniref:nucleoside-diphosphate sugar epimerase/dehydratase n=1 Tax=Nitrospirillum amazonense TaxID=28077 RepID=UPI0024125EB2|nr:hypothetical protein [Nitrospirillum amazonense]MDG3442929.1 hypothetical protein [Nitrospirillum amazonense]